MNGSYKRKSVILTETGGFSGIFTLASERELGYIYKKEMQKNKYSESIGGIHKCWKSITRRISLEKKIIRPE